MPTSSIGRPSLGPARVARRNENDRPMPSVQRRQGDRRAGQRLAQLAVVPDVGAAGAGGLADAEERADAVVDEAGREQVARGIGGGVADQHDRPAVLLADRVALVGIGDRHRLRVQLAVAHRGVERRLPRPELVGERRQRRHVARERRRQHREPRRLDVLGREQLQRELGGRDVAAGVAAHVDDQAASAAAAESARISSAMNLSGSASNAADAQVADGAARHLQRSARAACRASSVAIVDATSAAARARGAASRAPPETTCAARAALADQRLGREQQHLGAAHRGGGRIDGARAAQRLALAARPAGVTRRRRARIDDLPRHADLPSARRSARRPHRSCGSRRRPIPRRAAGRTPSSGT